MIVRPGTKKTDLSATFDIIDNLQAKQWLAHYELDADDECILRRVISAEGRSRAYINGTQVPLTQLKEVAQLLINIHGQHDHQLIVKANEQRKILDAFAAHQHLLDDVKHYYQQLQQQHSELVKLQESKQQRDAQQQLLQYQVNELNEFSLQIGEFTSLESDYKKFSHAQHIKYQAQQTLQLLSANEQFNILTQLQRVPR